MDTKLSLRTQRSFEFSRTSGSFLFAGRYGNDRQRIALSAMLLAHEHHSALVGLTKTSHHASAAAMLRPIAEASACAFWVTYVATKDFVSRLNEFKADTPTLDDMIRQLAASKVKPPDIEKLRDLVVKQDPSWRLFHKYTHGGMVQLDRRTRPEPFSEQENCLHLMQADAFLLPAVALGTVLFCSEELVEFVRETHNLLNAELQSYGLNQAAEWPGLPTPPELD